MNDVKPSTPRRKAPAAGQRPTRVRCAIYTRKSTEEGLDQDFNSLDAQREAGQAYIVSQRHAGWSCLPQGYDDGGYSGANIDRPALTQLLAAIAEGEVDCVVVYKVDRLSRSLLDFARLMETFERHGVSFVSVTQQFNTATSMGRLVLNVLLSFAQFEREMIAERTRDKIAATRRKGKWCGGIPRLGYDVQNGKLIVNEAEAQRVREIFALYLEQPSLTLTVRELSRRGWTTKAWITRKGQPRGGRSFTKNGLRSLLSNVVYLGQVRYKDEVHPGEHQALVDPETFGRVQQALERNSHRRGPNQNDPALLRGLLYCAACDAPMVYRYAVKKQRRYPYYVCRRATQRGWSACPFPSLPCGDVERFVVEQILRRGLSDSPSSGQAWSRLLAPWESLAPHDRLAIVDRLVERVSYDGQRIAITFRRDQALVDHLARLGVETS
jgi:site-specific DNA recombinase